MDCFDRKRTRPTIVTNRPEKKVCVELPLPTPEQQDGDVNYQPECIWAKALESEIELSMETLPKKFLDMPVLEDPQNAEETSDEVNVEVAQPPTKNAAEPITPPATPSSEKPTAEAAESLVHETPTQKDIPDVEATVQSARKAPEEPSIAPRQVVDPEPYVPKPVTPQAGPSRPPSYHAMPMKHFAPYRPIVESRAYQQQHRKAYNEHKAEVAKGQDSCPWKLRDAIDRIPKRYNQVKIVENGTRWLRQDFGVFPTEWIEKGSPYWDQVLREIGTRRGEVTGHCRSRHDNAPMKYIQYRNGRIKVTRNYVNVIIREKFEENTWTPIPHKPRKESLERSFVFPTEYISPDSPYYQEILKEDFYFPRDSKQWVHVYGRDRVKVDLCLGLLGESLMVSRDGVKVVLYASKE